MNKQVSTKTTAKDIMSEAVVVAHEEMSLEEALKLLVNNKVTGLPVVDKKGRMVGVVSEYDIIAQVTNQKGGNKEIFKNMISFSRKVEKVTEGADLQQIMELFVRSKIRRLPVVDKTDRLVGIISRRDIMRVLFYRSI